MREPPMSMSWKSAFGPGPRAGRGRDQRKRLGNCVPSSPSMLAANIAASVGLDHLAAGHHPASRAWCSRRSIRRPGGGQGRGGEAEADLVAGSSKPVATYMHVAPGGEASAVRDGVRARRQWAQDAVCVGCVDVVAEVRTYTRSVPSEYCCKKARLGSQSTVRTSTMSSWFHRSHPFLVKMPPRGSITMFAISGDSFGLSRNWFDLEVETTS